MKAYTLVDAHKYTIEVTEQSKVVFRYGTRDTETVVTISGLSVELRLQVEEFYLERFGGLTAFKAVLPRKPVAFEWTEDD